MYYEQDKAASYSIPSDNISLSTTSGQISGIPSGFKSPLRGIVYPNAQKCVGPRPTNEEWQLMVARFVACSSKIFHAQATRFNAPNPTTLVPASTPPYQPTPSQPSNDPPATFTPEFTLENTNYATFDNSAFYFVDNGQSSQSSQTSFCATNELAARDASTHYPGSQFGDALHHHVPPRVVPPALGQGHPVEALPQSLGTIGQLFEKNSFYVNEPYAVQASPLTATHTGYHAHHPTQIQKMNYYSPTIESTTGIPLHQINSIIVPALPTHFDFTFGIQPGQPAPTPAVQPQQYVPNTFEDPMLSGQPMSQVPAHCHMMDLNDIPVNSPMGEGGMSGKNTEAKTRKTSASATQFVNIGKENINPNWNTGVPQPTAALPSASSSFTPAVNATPIPFYKCLFCMDMIEGTRKAVRRHILAAHFSGRNQKEQVSCTCEKQLQIQSLPQHIISEIHYGSALGHCSICGAGFARANLLAAHVCKKDRISEPQKKKRRIE